MYVVYEGTDEVIVCTDFDEDSMKRLYFDEGGREYDEYDRHEYSDAPCINARLSVD